MSPVWITPALSKLSQITVAPYLPVRAKWHTFWKKKWQPRGQSNSHSSPRRRLYCTLLDRARSDPGTCNYKLLCKSPQEQLPEPVTTKKFLGFYNKLFLVPKHNNHWRPILDLSTLNKFLKTESFKKGDTRYKKDLSRRESGSPPYISKTRVQIHVQGQTY